MTAESDALRGKPGLGMVGLLLVEIIIGYERRIVMQWFVTNWFQLAAMGIDLATAAGGRGQL